MNATTMKDLLAELRAGIALINSSTDAPAAKRAAADVLEGAVLAKLDEFGKAGVNGDETETNDLTTLLGQIEGLKTLPDAPGGGGNGGGADSVTDDDGLSRVVRPAVTDGNNGGAKVLTRLFADDQPELNPRQQLVLDLAQLRQERADARKARFDFASDPKYPALVRGYDEAETAALKEAKAAYDKACAEIRKSFDGKRDDAELAHLNELDRLDQLANAADEAVQAKKGEIDQFDEAARKQAEAARQAEQAAAERRERLRNLAKSVTAAGSGDTVLRRTVVLPPPADPLPPPAPPKKKYGV